MKRRRYSTADYTEAMELLKHMGTRKASKLLGIPRSTLINWKHGQKPWQAKWTPKPTKELAYIIGVLMGDAYITQYIKNYQYDIRLAAKDRDFVELFNRYLAFVLGRNIHKIYFDRKRELWVVKYGSRAFYCWIRNLDFTSLKDYVEFNRKTVAFFLRGVFDSEGSVIRSGKAKIYKIKLTNTDLNLLEYVKHLLNKYFGIKVNGPYLERKAGQTSYKKDGEVIRRSKDTYRIEISGIDNVNKFIQEIGFSIVRKMKS